MSVLRRVLPLAGLLLAESGLLVGLHAVGAEPWAQVAWSDLPGWLARTPPVDAAMAAVRVAGLALGWWLLATTVLTAAAALGRSPALAARVRPVTWSLARAAVDRAAAVGVSAALLLPAAPVVAADAPPPPGRGDPAVTAGADEPPPPSDAGDAAAEPGPSPEPGEDAVPPRSHVVAPGEHLWAIAAADLHAQRGPAVAADEQAVAAHWRAVVARNAARLRSGDPDLVYPGERVELPDPPA